VVVTIFALAIVIVVDVPAVVTGTVIQTICWYNLRFWSQDKTTHIDRFYRKPKHKLSGHVI
jgi:hypothetical protein